MTKIGWAWHWRLGLLAGFFVIQLLPYPKQTNPPESGMAPMPAEIRRWAEPLCFDCHSQRTRFPWYSQVAPASWWIADEIRRGRAGLNFSRWPEYTPRQQVLAWRRSLQRIREKRMPPELYAWRHPFPLNDSDVRRLEEYVQQLARSSAELSVPELLAWPSRVLSTVPVALSGVFQAQGTVRRPLLLQDALVLAPGDLHLAGGVSGTGGILAAGKLQIDQLNGASGPLALIGMGGVVLRGKGRLNALIYSQGGIDLKGVSWSPLQEFDRPVSQVWEDRLEFCRDDGQLGELIERQVIVRYARSRFVLWDPEFQVVREAVGAEAALLQAEVILALDPATSLPRWRRRFRTGWEARLRQLEKGGSQAHLQLRFTRGSEAFRYDAKQGDTSRKASP